MKINRKALILSREQLRQIQIVELEILIEVDRICRENNIHYFLGYGTLLGAVRHKGFIPWDDDVDVIMLREDYDRFNEICKTKLDTSRFFWQTWDTDPNYRIGYGKMRRLNTEYVRVGQEKMGYHGGILIDIMPFDNVPDEGIERTKFLIKCRLYRLLMYSKAGSMCDKNFLKRIGYKILSLIPKEVIKSKFINYVKQYETKDAVDVSCNYANGYTVYYKEMFEKQVEMEFEKHMFFCPQYTRMFLKTAYGCDYMTPPPENERFGHAPISKYKVIKPEFYTGEWKE